MEDVGNNVSFGLPHALLNDPEITEDVDGSSSINTLADTTARNVDIFQGDDGFQNRLAESIALHRRILARLST